MGIYKKCKDMPNPSKGLLKFLKRSNGRIWAYKSNYYSKDFVTLKKLKTMDLHELILFVGSPRCPDEISNLKIGKGYIRSRSYSGISLKQHMFSGRKQGPVCLVGIGRKSKGVWMIDVTDRVIDELNKVGACALSKAHCQFKNISPRVRQCEYCERKLYKQTVIKKQVNWISKDEQGRI